MQEKTISKLKWTITAFALFSVITFGLGAVLGYFGHGLMDDDSLSSTGDDYDNKL
jgi:hypothetical protein